jgi:drug/metabolite transporter (DMT)-like permease
VTPLVAVIVGAIALDEKLPPQTYFGGALILGSVCLTAFRERAKSSYKHQKQQPGNGAPLSAPESVL